jgi:hypothetical protein
MSKHIAPVQPRQAPAISFEQQLILAEAFAKSGLFGVKTADQALALMALCEADGMHPARAIQEYHIIQGRPALKADAMMARFQAAGGRVKWLEMSDERVAAEFSHPSGGTVTIDWDKARAQQAGFWGKDNWKKFPRAMLRARVISEGIRTVFPGVVVGVYTPEEVQDFDQPKVKDMGPVTVEPEREQEHAAKPPYPQESIQKNKAAWAELIISGKKTPAQIIAMIETKATLTEEQKNEIDALKLQKENADAHH